MASQGAASARRSPFPIQVAPVPHTIAEAIALHREGHLVGARTLYRRILIQEPQNFDALHLLGVIHLQMGAFERTIEAIGRAARIRSDHASAHANLANAYRQLNRPWAARAGYRKALGLNPHDPGLHCSLGALAWAAGDAIVAISGYERAIAISPDHAEAHSGLAVAYQTALNHAGAMASYRKGIAAQPQHAGLHGNRGILLQALCRLEAATASYDRAIAIAPGEATFHSNRGNALRDLKRWNAAVASFDKAICLKPDYAEAFYNRGIALHEGLRLHQAAASYDRAIRIDPGYAEAYCNRGNTLKELKRLGAAVAHYRKAIALKPGYVEALYNQGNVLLELMWPGPAIISYDRATAIEPGNADAWSNRGNAFLQHRDVDEAIASYDQAIAVRPDHADAYWNKSLALLLSGDFARGLPLYEWRWRTAKTELRQRFPGCPAWLGAEPVAGRRVLLHSEQGLGDTIQFCRYARLVRDLGGYVILEAPRPLLAIFAGLEGVDRLVAQGDALPAFDLHCPLMSLPLAFRTDLASIPCPRPYLRCDADRKAAWERALGPRTGPRVGLVWSGSAVNKGDHLRSIPLGMLAPYLPGTLDYVSLQKEVRESEIELLRSTPRIRHFGDRIHDFADTAALCELMDVVVSVDTSVAHLSGALGKATWLLLPVVPDWRWLENRSDSPWYPSMRLYRQDRALDWEGVIRRVRDDLAAIEG